METESETELKNTTKIYQKYDYQPTSKISDIMKLKKNSNPLNNNEYIYYPINHDASIVNRNPIYKKDFKYINSSENMRKILNPLSSKVESYHINNKQVLYEEMKKHLFKVKKRSSPKIEAIKRYALEGEDGQNIKLKTLINQRVIMPRFKSTIGRSINQSQMNNPDVGINKYQSNINSKEKKSKQNIDFLFQKEFQNNERSVNHRLLFEQYSKFKQNLPLHDNVKKINKKNHKIEVELNPIRFIQKPNKSITNFSNRFNHESFSMNRTKVFSGFKKRENVKEAIPNKIKYDLNKLNRSYAYTPIRRRQIDEENPINPENVIHVPNKISRYVSHDSFAQIKRDIINYVPVNIQNFKKKSLSLSQGKGSEINIFHKINSNIKLDTSKNKISEKLEYTEINAQKDTFPINNTLENGNIDISENMQKNEILIKKTLFPNKNNQRISYNNLIIPKKFSFPDGFEGLHFSQTLDKKSINPTMNHFIIPETQHNLPDNNNYDNNNSPEILEALNKQNSNENLRSYDMFKNK